MPLARSARLYLQITDAAGIRMARRGDAFVTVWAAETANAAAKLPVGAGRLDAFASRIGMTRGDFASEDLSKKAVSCSTNPNWMPEACRRGVGTSKKPCFLIE